MEAINDPKNKKAENGPKSPEKKEDMNTGESVVQEGKDIVNEQMQTQVVNQEEQEEYIHDHNVITKVANEDDDKDANETGEKKIVNSEVSKKDDDDDDDDDDDNPEPDIEIGDDPDETKKKLPTM